MRIKSFSEFNESISGTELVGNVSMGPSYGDTKLLNKTVTDRHTSVKSSNGFKNPYSNNPLTDDIYFDDQYSDIFNRYIKSGGTISELGDDNSVNVKIMMDFLQED